MFLFNYIVLYGQQQPGLRYTSGNDMIAPLSVMLSLSNQKLISSSLLSQSEIEFKILKYSLRKEKSITQLNKLTIFPELEGGEEGCRGYQRRSEKMRAATSVKMTTLVIFLLLAQQSRAKPLIAGVAEVGDRNSEPRYVRALGMLLRIQ